MSRSMHVLAIVAALGASVYLLAEPQLGKPTGDAWPNFSPPRDIRWADCAVRDARYVLRGEPDVQMRFEPAPPRLTITPALLRDFTLNAGAGVAYRLDSPRGRRRFVAMETADSSATPYLFPISARGVVTPLQESRVVQLGLFDAHLEVRPPPETLAETAPKHIFAPALGRYLGGARGPAPMFDFDYCAAEPEPPRGSSPELRGGP